MRFLTLTLLLFSPVLLADEVTEYKFDMILFENIAARDTYLSDHAARAFINAVTLSADEQDEPETPVYDVDSGAFNYRENLDGALDGALLALEKSAQYRVLARKSWIQSGLQDGDRVRIAVDADPSGQMAGSYDLVAGGARPYLSGDVTFTFSRYIHLHTDLVIDHAAENMLAAAPVTLTDDTSRVMLERKLRSNETHYVDHPLLGVLINIERVKVVDPGTDDS